MVGFAAMCDNNSGERIEPTKFKILGNPITPCVSYTKEETYALN